MQLLNGTHAFQFLDAGDCPVCSQFIIRDMLCYQAGFQEPCEKEAVHIVDQRDVPALHCHVLQFMVMFQKNPVILRVRLQGFEPSDDFLKIQIQPVHLFGTGQQKTDERPCHFQPGAPADFALSAGISAEMCG